MPLAVFRADASQSIGGGHVMRCLAIAEWLGEAGWACAFACQGDAAATVPALGRSGLTLLTLAGTAESEPEALARAWQGGVDLLVVDHYRRAEPFEAACRPWAKAIAVIEDLPGRRHACDVLVEPTAAEGAARPRAGRHLCGPMAAPLRRQFARGRAAALTRHAAAAACARMLVSFGATDPARMTERAIAAASECLPGIAIDALLGAGAAATAQRVRDFAAAAGATVALHQDVDDVARLVTAADLAIGAAGVSAWERACLGLPSVVVPVADNQAPTAALLGQAGAAIDLTPRPGKTTGDMGEAVAALAVSAAARRRMAAAGAALCDGRGCLRLMLALLPELPVADGRSVGLRLAAAADRDPVLAWQQAPDTRRFARDPRAPTEGEHARWFAAKLADDATILCIVTHGSEPAGVLRFDTLAGADAREISILVAPDRHGRGIGQAALALGRTLLPGLSLEAEVLPDNERSHRLFRGAGFRPSAPGRYVSPGGSGAASVRRAAVTG